jgi:hypothetical protein
MRLGFVFLAWVAAVALGQPLPTEQVLQPSRATGDYFGVSVDIAEDFMVVGSPFDDVEMNANQGSASVYRRSASGWVFDAFLTLPEGRAGDLFGASVAIFDQTIVVGIRDDDVGSITDQGSAVVFSREASGWVLQAQLFADDGATGDLFGCAVDVYGEFVVAGAMLDEVSGRPVQGSAYLFQRTSSGWRQIKKLIAPNGNDNDYFGTCVAITSDRVVVSAPYGDLPNAPRSGQVFVYARTPTDWVIEASLNPIGIETGDAFGASLAIDGDRIVVGAYLNDVMGSVDRGSAFVFARSNTNWIQEAELGPQLSSVPNQKYGAGVTIAGELIGVGSQASASLQGAVRLFSLTGAGWVPSAQLLAPDHTPEDSFGVVSIHGATAAIGVPNDDVQGTIDCGSAWVFALNQICLPTIVSASPGSSICAESRLELSVVAMGQSLQYQWRKDGLPIGGATLPTYSKDFVSTADAGLYDCLVQNSCGTATSSVADIAVRLPQVVTQPMPQNVGVDQPVAFAVETNTASPCDSTLVYQWQRRNPLVLDDTAPDAWIDLVSGGGFVGVNAPSLIILRPTPGLATGYRCRISNACGCEADSSGVIYTDVVNYSAACPSDFNLDGSVDGDDVIMFFERWDVGC